MEQSLISRIIKLVVQKLQMLQEFWCNFLEKTQISTETAMDIDFTVLQEESAIYRI